MNKLSKTEASVCGELPMGAQFSGEAMKIVLWRIQVTALVLRFFRLKTSSRCRFSFAFKLHFGHRSSLAVKEIYLFLVVGQLTAHIFVNPRPPCMMANTVIITNSINALMRSSSVLTFQQFPPSN